MSDTYCILPFIHLEARSDSFVTPCCMSQEFYKRDNGSPFTLTKDTLNDVWQSTSIQTLRTALINGEKPTACNACWLEESFGAESKRLRENKRWLSSRTSITLPTTAPKFLDLKFGNTCNLKCRICCPGSSSLWVKEHNDVYGKPSSDIQKAAQWPEQNERFWTELDDWLPTVELFEIYGGEPFLIKRHFELLKKSVALGYSKNQSIHYNTNGTIWPQDAIDNIWPYFKDVDIMFSIDGIGPQFEYQRFPAVWSVVENNLLRLLNTKHRVQICLSVSMFNVYYLTEYLDYFATKNIEVWVNIVYTPQDLCVQHLPNDVKTIIVDKFTNSNHIEQLEPILRFIRSPGQDKYFKNFLAKVQLHDVYRQQNFSQVFTDYARILGL